MLIYFLLALNFFLTGGSNSEEFIILVIYPIPLPNEDA